MELSLAELLHNCTNTPGIPAATYCTLFGIRSKYTISTAKFGDFIDGYCKLAYDDEKEDMGEGLVSTELNIAETIDSKTTLPLIGNFVFKFHVDEGDEETSYYGTDLPLRIVKCYQKAMSELLNISPGMSEYICCVLEGHSYRKNDQVKINLMVQFPFCQLDIKYTKKIFRPYVEKLLRQNKVIEAFDTSPIGDWHDLIVDFENAVPLYRSSMEPQAPHLALTHIYGLVEDSHIDEEDGPEIDLGSIFNPSTHSFIYSGKIPVGTIALDKEDDEDEDEFYRYWIPLFLSIHFWSGQTTPKEVSNDMPGNKNIKRSAYEIDEMDSENPIRMVHALLPLLNIDRVNKDYCWLDVGRVLYNVYKGSKEGLDLWISFSSKSSLPGRDAGICMLRYPEFRGNLLSVGTIAWYAKEDNPGAYEEWHTAWCQKSLSESLTITHADVAKAIYRIFWLEYVFSNDTGNWYEYRGNHYYKIGREPIPLRRNILNRFVPIFERMRLEISRSAVDGVEGLETKDTEYKVKAVNNLIMKLKNENYRTTVVKASKDMFNIEEFEKKCDRNHFLTATGNCVLEVVDKKVRPRPGKPEDFIMKFTEVTYPFDYSWESHWVKEVLSWFDKITVGNWELKHYFLKRLSSFLRGLNPEKLFDVWTNEGNGGKSVLARTLQYMFGAYFIDFPVSLLTSGNGKNSSGPSPELAQAVNARGAILSEPDDRDPMKGGIIKRITGGDRIFTRALHDNGGSMELTFKTIMICNRIPDIANVDKALINRFVIMPFLGVWCDDAPETEEEQFKQRKFKVDPFFDSNIPHLARALLWVIVQYYPKYAEEGLSFPPIVKEYIKKHWEDNDYYLQFIAERIEYAYKDGDKKEIDTDANLAVSQLYPFFTRWFKDYYPGMPVPTTAQFKADICMSGRLGPQPKRGVWLGIRMKSITPDLNGGIKI